MARNRDFSEFLLVLHRAFAGVEFEVFVEVGKIVETAFKANLSYGNAAFGKQLAGMADPEFKQKLRIGFTAAAFEIPAKRMRADIGHLGDFFDRDLFLKVGNRVLVNMVDAVGVVLIVLVLVLCVGKYVDFLAMGEGFEYLHQRDDRITVGLVKEFVQKRFHFIGPFAEYLHPKTGFHEQIADRLVFGQSEKTFTKDIFRKMDDSGLCIKLAAPVEVLFVATPVMR